MGSPTCSAVATKQNEFLMLSCDWAGGLPRVTLWWRDWWNRVLGGLKPSSNIYVMQANSTLGGKEFACIAAHPLQARATECLVRLGKQAGCHPAGPQRVVGQRNCWQSKCGERGWDMAPVLRFLEPDREADSTASRQSGCCFEPPLGLWG